MIVFNVFKRFGIYSRDCYSFLSRFCKVGHCGTLDKYAKGVLVVVTNRSTKISILISQFRKQYFFTILFDCDTFTNDLYGCINQYKCTRLSLIEIENICDHISSYKGLGFSQKCPLISAKKLNGKPMYNYFFQRKKSNSEHNIVAKFNNVFIYNVTICSYSLYSIDVCLEVSSGFYVRSFVRDVGKHFGIFTFVYNIHRLRVGFFDVTDSL